MTQNSHLDFLLRRAEEEAISAMRCDCMLAAAVHFDLSLRYGVLARAALIEATGRSCRNGLIQTVD